MRKKRKKLYAQDAPSTTRLPKNARKKRPILRQKVFQFLFKGVEALWMLVQIVQYICEFFKK